jgi:hypothetical protein
MNLKDLSKTWPSQESPDSTFEPDIEYVTANQLNPGDEVFITEFIPNAGLVRDKRGNLSGSNKFQDCWGLILGNLHTIDVPGFLLLTSQSGSGRLGRLILPPDEGEPDDLVIHPKIWRRRFLL